MSTNKSITFENCEYNNKYDKLGVTPKELYYRQNGLCWLELIHDSIDGKKIPGDLYCTDGNEYALTNGMCNPTYECAVCISDFMIEREKAMQLKNQLDTKIVSLLMMAYSAKSHDETVPTEFYMSRKTFDYIEEHVKATTLFSEETNPIRVTPSAKLMAFGFQVNLVNDVEEGLIMIQPGNLTINVKDH